MTTVGIYPMDVIELGKGSVISVEDVEFALSCSRTDAGYWAKVLRLRDFIEEEFRAVHGMVVTVVREGDGLRVLHDDDAAEYNPRKFDEYLRRATKAHVRLRGIDRSQLTDAARTELEWRQNAESRLVQALNRERKALKSS